MTHFQIQQIVSAQTTEMTNRQQSELRALRTKWEEDKRDLITKHKQDRSDLQAKHMEMYREYRETPSDSSSRIVEHNREVQRKTLPDVLRDKFNIYAETDEEFIEKIKQRLKDMTKSWKNCQGLPAELRRLERGEDKLRAAIRTLGGNVEEVPFIGASAFTPAKSFATMDNIDDILNAN